MDSVTDSVLLQDSYYDELPCGSMKSSSQDALHERSGFAF